MEAKIFSVEARETSASLIEECVIGMVVQAAMLDTTEEAQRVITLYLDSGMTEAWFANPHAKKVFASMVRLWRETHRIDVYLIGESCGETDYAMACGEKVSSSANADEYCETLRRKYVHRTFTSEMARLIQRSGPDTIAETLSQVDALQKKLKATEAQATANQARERLAAAGIVFQEWRSFMDNPPAPFDWIITDVVAKGMKGDVNAKSKCRKSFFGMQLALCVATGQPFLGMQVPRPRRTVYFNLELMECGSWERGAAMEGAMGPSPVSDMLFIVNLRGKADKLRKCTNELVAEVRRLGIELVILDPRYKLIRDGEDENSAVGLRGVLQFRDALTEAAAVLMIVHDPKGDTAGKSMGDRGAGSYTAGADYDFSFALSPHEQDDYSVLSTSCRYRKSPADISIRFDPERQMFDVDVDTPPTVRQTKRGGGGTAASKDASEILNTDIEMLVKDLKETPQTHGEITKHRCGLTQRRFNPAWKMISKNFLQYGLAAVHLRLGKSNSMVFYGLAQMAERRAEEAYKNWCDSTCNDFKLSDFHKLSQTFKTHDFLTFTGLPPTGVIPDGESWKESHPVESLTDGAETPLTQSAELEEPELLTDEIEN